MDRLPRIYNHVIINEDEKTGEKSVWVDYEDFRWLGKTILALRIENAQIKKAYEDRVSDIESYLKALEEIKDTYVYGQPNHEGEVMADCDVTCDHMYQIALDATTITDY